MKDREIISLLLLKEVDITNKIHNAVTEIMRLGIESERGKKIVPDTIDSIRYCLDELEIRLNRK